MSKEKLRQNIQGAVLCLGFGWLLMLCVRTALSPEAGFGAQDISDRSAAAWALLALLPAAAMLAVRLKYPSRHFTEYGFTAALTAFSFFTLFKTEDIYAYVFLAIVIMLTLYCLDKKLSPSFLHRELKNETVIIAAACFSVFAACAVTVISVLRYKTYSSPGYDFGIFCNMFYNMKRDLSMTVSCERDKLLSHAAVHISPIFYLLLPVYFVFPSPVTLAAAQPIIIFSGVIPLYLLAKKLKLHNNAVLLLCAAFALYTPLFSGCFYDLHENCFMVPLLLWSFYFFEKQKKIPMFAFILMTLFVKEDAFVYVAVFALYIMIARGKYLQGFSALAVSAAYFGLCCFILNRYGEGIMASRYENLSPDAGLYGAVKNIIFNSGFAFSQIFKTKDGSAEKILYALRLLLPLALIPLRSKKYARYILILPIFINLVTQYKYQFNIGYQYSFSVSAFLFYLSALNLSEMKERKQVNAVFCAALSGLLLFGMTVLPEQASYIEKYQTYKESYRTIDSAVEKIPESASVTASAFLIPHLADRRYIFEDEYHEIPSTEFFVLDLRGAKNEERAEKYIEAGYKLIYKADNLVAVYQNENMKYNSEDNIYEN